MDQLQKLEEKWLLEKAGVPIPVEDSGIRSFEAYNNVILPEDIRSYFKRLNGTCGEYTNDLFNFYPLKNISPVKEACKDKNGIPNYQSLVSVDEVKGLFVFADYMFDAFLYAIRLYPDLPDNNEVYVLCGDKYEKIANSFTGFIERYLEDSGIYM